MPSKKEKKALPAVVVIVIGIISIFLFFITATFAITQVRVKTRLKNIQQKENFERQEAEGILRSKAATKELKRKDDKLRNEKNGVLLSASKEEIIIEIENSKKDDKEREALRYKITDKTIIILSSNPGDDKNDVVGTLDDLEEGNIVSVRGDVSDDEEKNAEIIKIFK